MRITAYPATANSDSAFCGQLQALLRDGKDRIELPAVLKTTTDLPWHAGRTLAARWACRLSD